MKICLKHSISENQMSYSSLRQYYSLCTTYHHTGHINLTTLETLIINSVWPSSNTYKGCQSLGYKPRQSTETQSLDIQGLALAVHQLAPRCFAEQAPINRCGHSILLKPAPHYTDISQHLQTNINPWPVRTTPEMWWRTCTAINARARPLLTTGVKTT